MVQEPHCLLNRITERSYQTRRQKARTRAVLKSGDTVSGNGRNCSVGRDAANPMITRVGYVNRIIRGDRHALRIIKFRLCADSVGETCDTVSGKRLHIPDSVCLFAGDSDALSSEIAAPYYLLELYGSLERVIPPLTNFFGLIEKRKRIFLIRLTNL